MRLLIVRKRHIVNHMMFLIAILFLAHGNVARAGGDSIIIGKTGQDKVEVKIQNPQILLHDCWL